MYVLTIVFLTSHIVVTSVHATQEACELSADRARAFTQGSQAVESARCEPLAPGKAPP